MKSSPKTVRRLASFYPVTVRWSEEDQSFIGTVHGLIGDCCHGDDPLQVFKEASEIAHQCVEVAAKNGFTLPQPAPATTTDPEPRNIRRTLGLSQVQFAQALGISAKTLYKWEQHTSRPSGAARTLLRIAAMEPSAVRRVLGTGQW